MLALLRLLVSFSEQVYTEVWKLITKMMKEHYPKFRRRKEKTREELLSGFIFRERLLRIIDTGKTDFIKRKEVTIGGCM